MQSTHTYSTATDSWKDRLTSYNGQTITYDSIGNPLTYNNGSAYTFTWEGRQMQTATKGNTTWTYTYNADGLRTGKTNGTTTYTYTWNDGKLTSQTWGNSYMLFYYNAEGKPLYVEYHDANDECSGTYYYVLNLQGDTVALYDPARNITAVNYEYDAWGKEISWSTYDSGYAGLIFNNPLTYRGYIYDSETGFYYLQSRYYDPSVGRFLNADDTRFIDELNLFFYCGNNPVNKKDNLGYFGTPIQWACAAIGGVLGVFFGDSIARLMGLSPSGNWWNRTKYWVVRAAVIIGGAAIGYLIGTAIVKLVAVLIQANPTIVFNLANKLGISTTIKIMKAFGLNFMSLMPAGTLINFADKYLSSPSLKLSLDFVKMLYEACKKLGISMSVHTGHPGTEWNVLHLHIGKRRIHLALLEEAYNWLKGILGG